LSNRKAIHRYFNQFITYSSLVIFKFIYFSGVFAAFARGFIKLWRYGQGWFLNFSVAGINLRVLLQMHPINFCVAVWVGFIALFGIATYDGVILGT